jgi:Uma2 family endonuclease
MMLKTFSIGERKVMQEIEVRKKVDLPIPFSDEEISFEDYLVKYDGQHAEWIGGKVITFMSASDLHQDLMRFLISILSFFVEAHNLGVIRPAPFAMKIKEETRGREPDILFLAKENLDRLKPTYLNGPADLAIEIISPESIERDRDEKFYEYEEAGVPEYWMLDPTLKRAEFYALGEDGVYRPISIDENGIFRSVMLRGLELKVEWLWQKPLPTLMSVLKEWKLV